MSRILVTGGSRGIGRAICVRLVHDALQRGLAPKIVVTATGTSPDLQALVAELQSMGAQALAVTGDLNDPAVPERLVDQAVEFCGGLDTVIHNAGGNIAGTLLKTSVEDWDTVFAVNCRAFFLLGKAANRALRESKGSMCAIGSAAAERVQAFTNAYPVAKAALVMLMQQMAYEWGRYGIRVNCVSPGLSLSRSTESAFATDEDQKRVGAHIPLRRLGQPEDVASLVAFVVGPDASYLTGENINVDGGLRHIGSEQMLATGGTDYSANKPGGGMRPQKP
jgi:NAD(P)-dependent dehydrogenase (short-subunit alcohol dehydrogenase family)